MFSLAAWTCRSSPSSVSGRPISPSRWTSRAGRLDPGLNRVGAVAAGRLLGAAEAHVERHGQVAVLPAAGQLDARQPLLETGVQVDVVERELRAGQMRDGVAQLGIDPGQHVAMQAEATARCLLVVLHG